MKTKGREEKERKEGETEEEKVLLLCLRIDSLS